MVGDPQQRAEGLWLSKEVVGVACRSYQAQHRGLAPHELLVHVGNHSCLQEKY